MDNSIKQMTLFSQEKREREKRREREFYKELIDILRNCNAWD